LEKTPEVLEVAMKVLLKIEFELDMDSVPKNIGEIIFDNIVLPGVIIGDKGENEYDIFVENFTLMETKISGD